MQCGNKLKRQITLDSTLFQSKILVSNENRKYPELPPLAKESKVERVASLSFLRK
jgi:hypothetical protein